MLKQSRAESSTTKVIALELADYLQYIPNSLPALTSAQPETANPLINDGN